MKHSLSPHQIRAEARTKQKHNFDAGESSRPIKQAERKRKVIVFDDDFVEDVPISKPGKKAKVSPSSKTLRKKKNSKKSPSVKSPKNIRKQSLVKFTNINESPEDLLVMSLPDKVEYIIEKVEYVSEDLKVDAPPLEPKESIGKEDKESILRKIRKLKRGLEKITCIPKQHCDVDEKLEDFRKDVFEEQGSLRVLINDSVKTVLQVINSPNDQVDAKVHLVKKIIQHVLIYIDILKGQLMKRMQREDMHAQSPIHEVTVAAQREQQNEEDENVGEELTNINESPEELSVMSLPNKVEYIIEKVEHVSEDPKVDAPLLEPKESIGKEDKESILRKIRKLKRGLEKVDEKLEDFRKDVFEELGSLRVLINDSVKTVLQAINSPNDQVDAKNMLKVHLVKKIIQQELIYIDILKGQLMKRMQREDMHAQSPIHEVTVAAQREQQNEEDDNVGEEAEYVNIGDSEDSGGEKKEVTLDDFELPDNFSSWLSSASLYM
ncbi:MAR-binding filament-like protein 1-1 [Nicotiana sylvestris]|uniref:MAR-binding filament-like protein 1-1 n=1 Tax=Nicotiana sylvestris TaxID=4096 RepID=UPI00388CA8A4